MFKVLKSPLSPVAAKLLEMCETKYISNLFASTPAHFSTNNRLQVSMKRSDGELFTVSLTMLTADEADKIKKLFNYFEELRTCTCTKFSVYEKHSNLEKKS